MTFLSTRTWQYTYFARQLGEPVWRGKDVLDFGGNIGNMLRDPNSTVDVGRYWCIDIDEEALRIGRRRYPEAHWLHYDRYCFFFNPRGAPFLKLPPIEQRFDYILAYSVFTNTPTADMLDLVEQLRALLKEGGALAFTFIDPRHRSWPDSPERRDWDNLRWRLEKVRIEENPDVDVDSMAERARAASRQCILVNGSDLYLDTDEIAHYEPEAQRTCYVFHTEEYVKSLFPGATVLPPANDEMQHCCVVRRAREIE
ncbi:MAG TPA: class I SAM-dependent methyltransferase [Pyrinomonadaceae bacterium]|jgi:SAM-dependent methyltransferase|nr:class I SAM-dependent methyltransferase [Pyrinomonadaceae bacterium]